MSDEITLEDLKRIQEEIERTHYRPPMPPLYPHALHQHIGEIPVISIPLNIVPKIQISPDFKWCTDEFRDEMDGWLIRMFGCYDRTPVPKGQAYMIDNGMLAVRRDEMHAFVHMTGA